MYQSTNSLDNVIEVVTDKIRCEAVRVKLPPSSNFIPGSMSTTTLYPAGTAPVKAEFVQSILTQFFVHRQHHIRFLLSVPDKLQPQIDDASAEEGLNLSATKRKQDGNSSDHDIPKKTKLSGAARRKLTKEEKKAQRGSNKGRRWAKVRDEVDLCWRFAGSGKCDFGSECAFLSLASRLVSWRFDPLISKDVASRTTSPPISKRNPETFFSLRNPC